MNIEITKKMALNSLRPNVDAHLSRGVPSDEEIEAERVRLTKHMSSDEKKVLKRQAHPVHPDELLDMIEALTARVASQASTHDQLVARVAALEAKGK